MEEKRLYWIDAIKLLACVLVALGHLLQSFVKAGIMPETQGFLRFDQSIYAFHVPLFFICSGYLYQSHSKVNSFAAWKKNVIKKLTTLGIPYIVFTSVTWLIKKVLENDVNSPVGGFFSSLFTNPIMQYWYLYCLMLLFIVIPTARSRRASFIFLLLAVCLKFLSFYYDPGLFVVSTVINNAVWFVMGMCFSTMNYNEIVKEKKNFCFGVIFLLLFFACSYFEYENWSACVDFIAGVLACLGIVCTISYWCANSSRIEWIQHLSKYTMPIYLMHTLFAAAARIFLLKLNIQGLMIHFTFGIISSFILPIIATNVILRTKWLSWILMPRIKQR